MYKWKWKWSIHRQFRPQRLQAPRFPSPRSTRLPMGTGVRTRTSAWVKAVNPPVLHGQSWCTWYVQVPFSCSENTFPTHNNHSLQGAGLHRLSSSTTASLCRYIGSFVSTLTYPLKDPMSVVIVRVHLLAPSPCLCGWRGLSRKSLCYSKEVKGSRYIM